MATLYDYAALSALAYNFGNDRGNVNKLTTPLLAGWAQLDIPNANNSLTGFTAAAYQNTTTKEIVIAYKGTDFFSSFRDGAGTPDWNRLRDKRGQRRIPFDDQAHAVTQPESCLTR
jgi:hypothetical protein